MGRRTGSKVDRLGTRLGMPKVRAFMQSGGRLAFAPPTDGSASRNPRLELEEQLRGDGELIILVVQTPEVVVRGVVIADLGAELHPLVWVVIRPESHRE